MGEGGPTHKRCVLLNPLNTKNREGLYLERGRVMEPGDVILPSGVDSHSQNQGQICFLMSSLRQSCHENFSQVPLFCAKN